ncbi:hypothetical protein ACS0TY_033632 [Phlomoides rotata]
MASSSSCKSSNTILLALIVFLSISLSSADAQFVDYCIADEQAAEDWACNNGADCTPIQPHGRCFFPNTTIDHTSYAFNSYYQNMKHNGGSCYFTAAAVLTCLDPSKQTP